MNRLQDYLSRLPTGRKLILMMLSAVLGIASIASFILITCSYLFSKNTIAPANVQTVSRILSQPAFLNTLLADRARAAAILQESTECSQIMAVGVYRSDGSLHASFVPQGLAALPNEAPKETTHETEYLKQVRVGPDKVITVYLQADASLPIDFYTSMTIAVIAIAVFIALFNSLTTTIIERIITQPVFHLTSIASKVSLEENYSIRAREYFHDDIGVLARTFNIMLARIEARERLLSSAKDKAEQTSQQAQKLAVETHINNKQLEQEVLSRKETEFQLAQLQYHLNSIVDSMPSALVAVDEQLAVTQWNREASMLTGLSHDQAVGLFLGEVMPFLMNTIDQVQGALDNEKAVYLERLRLALPTGSCYMDMVVYPLTDTDQHGAVIRLDDISRRIQLDEMMVQTEKMMSVGGLAAGMAHEINNPLGAILQSVQNIKRRLSPELPTNMKMAKAVDISLDALDRYLSQREINTFLNNIHDAGVRASQIIANMLHFTHQGIRDLIPTPIADLVTQTLDIAASDAYLKRGFELARLTVKQEIDAKLPPVPCIANEIQQVLLNLLKNAGQAISKREEADQPGLITIKAYRDGEQAIITVEDNGVGMPEDIRKRIFEPFYTTKDIGSGTGLGLSVSYFIITNNHNGSLEVYSAPEFGSIFTIKLALEQQQP